LRRKGRKGEGRWGGGDKGIGKNVSLSVVFDYVVGEKGGKKQKQGGIYGTEEKKI